MIKDLSFTLIYKICRNLLVKCCQGTCISILYTSGEDGTAAKSLCSVLSKKYVLLSWVCGALCVLLGVLFLVIHVLVVTRTASLEYFQTIPAYIPAVMVSLC